MRIVIPTYRKTHWALKPFTTLFNKYWPYASADIMCYSKPIFRLPKNFKIVSVDPIDYPRNLWAEGLCKYLEMISDKAVVVLLEDYWLTRMVNVDGISVLENVIGDNVLRVDLTTDRLYAGGVTDIGHIGYFDLVEAPGSQYQMSLQAGMWNRELLIKVIRQLKPGNMSSWDVELEGTNVVNASGYRVFGTRQNPVRYINGINDANGIIKSFSGCTTEDEEMIKKYIEQHNSGLI